MLSDRSRAASPAAVYAEHPRTYRSTALLAVAIVVGFAVDLALGGGPAHAWAWAAALVVVVGFDAVSVTASQRLRSIVVTSDRLVVGEHSFARADIIGVDVPAGPGVRAVAPAPRRAVLVGVRTAAGGTLGVPTRAPETLAAVLGFRTVPEMLTVRTAEPADFPELPEVERRADVVFTVAGIGPLPDASSAAAYAGAHAVLVAGRPAVGLARLEVVDGLAHLEQLAVLPAHMRRGVGGALLEAACERARADGFAAITLCTFESIAWNGPFYARHGFVVLSESEFTPGVRALRAAERAEGMDALGTRIVMRRTL